MNDGIHRALGTSYFSIGDRAHANPKGAVVSKSLLWDFFPNPKKWLQSPPKTITPAMLWGSMVDCMALTPLEFQSRFVRSEFPDFRTKAAREWRDSMADSGVEVVSGDVMDEVVKASEALASHPLVGPLIESDESQVAAVATFTEPSTGIKLRAKCLMDLVNFEKRRITDIKTTGADCSSERTLSNLVCDRGYHVQLAWYAALLEVVTGEEWEDLSLVFQESSPPYYTTRPLPLEPCAIGKGREWIQAALRKWAECAHLGEWDAHDPLGEVTFLDIPRYAYMP